jgi:enoyl-CoA hydratase
MTPDEPRPDDQDRVLAEQIGRVRVLTLHRPEKLNAADLAMQRRLNERWQEVADDHDTRAVVLAGSGRAFCAGGDADLLATFDGAHHPVHEELSALHSELLRTMLTLEIPIVAAVQGAAVGFGAELAALCDLVVMGDDASLSDPHVPLGIAPSPGCQLVWPHLTSVAVARELLLTGRRVGAAEAVVLGLANRVCPAGEERATALTLATELAALPPTGVAAAKRAFAARLLDDLDRLDGLSSA